MTYYHGTITELPIGTSLIPGIVGGSDSDLRADQKRVWATTTGPGMAWEWGARRARSLEAKLMHVFEIDLEGVEPDINGLRADPGSVMARSGTVVRAVGSFISRSDADGAG